MNVRIYGSRMCQQRYSSQHSPYLFDEQHTTTTMLLPANHGLTRKYINAALLLFKLSLAAAVLVLIWLLVYGQCTWSQSRGQIQGPETSTSNEETQQGSHDSYGSSQERRQVVAATTVTNIYSVNRNTKQILVHFDLKGAPPKVSYFLELFPLLRKFGATGILMEWEDMFPYTGNLSVLRLPYAYTAQDVEQILQAAKQSQLKVIPLVQTFGHMEWVLKHPQFQQLREFHGSPQSICPTNPRTLPLLYDLIDQVVSLHRNHQLDALHIGSDEVRHLAVDTVCQDRIRTLDPVHSTARHKLYLEHVSTVAGYVRNKHKLPVLMWNDHIAEMNVTLLKLYRLPELGVEPVMWGYAETFAPGYFPEGSFGRMGQTFGGERVWIGTAYKGANGQNQTFMNVQRYQNNHNTWLRALSEKRSELESVKGVVLTGWQRYFHYAPLCELLPVSIPSMVLNALTMKNGLEPKLGTTAEDPGSVVREAKRILNCKLQSNSKEEWSDCSFPGIKLYRKIEKLKYLKSAAVVASNRSDWIEFGRQLRHTLNKYFFNDSVNEWLYQNIQLPQLDKLKLVKPSVTIIGDDVATRAATKAEDLEV